MRNRTGSYLWLSLELRWYLHGKAGVSENVSAMFNVLLDLFHSIHPGADPYKMSIAEFSI